MTGILEESLLGLAPILPCNQHRDLAVHAENVLVLNSLHSPAFDVALSTTDSWFRIRTSPSFDPLHRPSVRRSSRQSPSRLRFLQTFGFDRISSKG